MKTNITCASDWEYKESKIFNSLEELQNFIIESKHGVLINKPNHDDTWEILIYDDYIE